MITITTATTVINRQFLNYSLFPIYTMAHSSLNCHGTNGHYPVDIPI